jgi:hypothetical protein
MGLRSLVKISVGNNYGNIRAKQEFCTSIYIMSDKLNRAINHILTNCAGSETISDWALSNAIEIITAAEKDLGPRFLIGSVWRTMEGFQLRWYADSREIRFSFASDRRRSNSIFYLEKEHAEYHAFEAEVADLVYAIQWLHSTVREVEPSDLTVLQAVADRHELKFNYEDNNFISSEVYQRICKAFPLDRYRVDRVIHKPTRAWMRKVLIREL